jgi:hypothetical protein
MIIKIKTFHIKYLIEGFHRYLFSPLNDFSLEEHLYFVFPKSQFILDSIYTSLFSWLPPNMPPCLLVPASSPK